VLAIVFQAVVRIGSRALGNAPRMAVAAGAFAAIFLFDVPFPAIVLAAGLIGWFVGRSGGKAFAGGGHGSTQGPTVSDSESALGTGVPDHAKGDWRRALRLSALLLILWLGPVAALFAFAGPDSVFSRIAGFFAQMAVVTFGGAYAVLAWVAQAAVERYGWLAPSEMLDGLGLAETTPGPLIMVTQFVGFLGAYRNAGAMEPLLAATLGGLLTTWVTFVPCFLWIFLGAPFIERLRGNAALSGALSAITAAVVGVVLNLALWFALHYIFGEVREGRVGPDLPVLASVNWAALALSAAALVVLLRFKVPVPWLLAGCALAGLALSAF
jgi:chromate transporter